MNSLTVSSFFTIFALLGSQVNSLYINPATQIDSPLEDVTDDAGCSKPPPEIVGCNNSTDFLGNIDERGPYYGGDMILSDQQLEEAKQGIVGTNYRWPKGQIPFTFDPAFTSNEKSVVQSAINAIQSQTCIRFIPRTNEVAYLRIVRGTSTSGCFAAVGRQGNAQTANFQPGNPGCFVMGVVAHELIHTIGFQHEQCRSDRDNFVTVNYQNIQSGMSFNFDKYSASQVTSYAPYDFGSIMHYSATAFSSNNKPTLLPKDGTPLSVLGQRNNLSARDAQKINAMYSGIC